MKLLTSLHNYDETAVYVAYRRVPNFTEIFLINITNVEGTNIEYYIDTDSYMIRHNINNSIEIKNLSCSKDFRAFNSKWLLIFELELEEYIHFI